MIAQRLATSHGFVMITPASLKRCGFADCKYACYLDGAADPDPSYHCDLFDLRTDNVRLPECLQACDPSLVEQMRGEALQFLLATGADSAEVNFPPVRSFTPQEPGGLVHRTLRFYAHRLECPRHGTVTAAALQGETFGCPRCPAG